ncbi:MAG: hypothetical protein EZS28_039405, partial [Streblomastix strix]
MKEHQKDGRVQKASLCPSLELVRRRQMNVTLNLGSSLGVNLTLIRQQRFKIRQIHPIPGTSQVTLRAFFLMLILMIPSPNMLQMGLPRDSIYRIMSNHKVLRFKILVVQFIQKPRNAGS